MKSKILKAVAIILIIITMTMHNFLIIGAELVSYAVNTISDDTTNHDNVKFTAYFKNQQGNKLTSTEYAIDNSDMKLYMSIEVKNEGYFDGTVFCENSNFNIKSEITNENISKIEGNTITLNRITSGKKVEIEVGIEPIIKENYELNLLNMESEVKISGTYKDSSQKDTNIYATKKVNLKLITPENIQTTLQTRTLTNKVYKINGENKRVIQIEMKSGVAQNIYPVKNTTLEIADLPDIESIQVSTNGTAATNGEKEKVLDENSYEFNKKDNLLKINLENVSKDGNISWKENAVDTVIATFVLASDVQIEKELTIKSKIEFYDSKEIENNTTCKIEEEKEGIIEVSINNDEESIYKGKLYSKEQREYQTTTNIEVNYVGTSEYIKLRERTQYSTEEEAKLANIQYTKTIISKDEITKVLGNSGSIVFKDQNGNLQTTITNYTKADENGNIIINYGDGVKELTIEVTEPIQVGIIRMKHTKLINAEQYTKEEIKLLKAIEEVATTKYNEEGQEHKYTQKMNLKDTISTVNLSVVPQTLATTSINEQVKIAITLKTDDEMYELFKNPTIKVKLPDCIKSIHTEKFKASKLYLDEFTVKNFIYREASHEIEIELLGEQKAYTKENTNGYIEILADIELEEFTPNKKDTIILNYTNENGDTLANGGRYEVPINITGYNGLVAFNNIVDYNLKGNSVTKGEQIGNLKTNADAREANFQIVLLNNVGDSIDNIKVVGNFPVKGTIENTIQANLKSGINTNGIGTVYYTENKNATKDLNNAENGWTTNLQEIPNPVLYMIQINHMEKEGSLVANYTMNIPANLGYGQEMKTTYTVDYVSKEVSKTIETATTGLETGNVLVTLDATVGGEKLENYNTVKTGEVIRYKITVTNNGGTDANDIKINALVPEGTILVKPYYESDEKNFVYEDKYYEEYSEAKTIEENIEVLKPNESKVIEYEVKVKSNGASTLKNKATIVYNNDIEAYSNETTYNVENGDIVVTIKRAIDLKNKLTPNQRAQYFVVVENVSDKTQKNLKLNIKYPEELTLTTIEKPENAEEKENGIVINSLEANSRAIFQIYFRVNEISEDKLETFVSAIAEKDSNKYRSNDYKETIYGYKVDMQVKVTDEGKILEAGDFIEYEIIVTNNSLIYTGLHELNIDIPKQLTIKKIEKDGVEQEITNENVYFEQLALDAKGSTSETKNTTKIKITAIINYDENRLETEEIVSKIELSYTGIVKDERTIVHYLKSIVEEPIVDPDNPPIDPIDPDKPSPDPDPDNPDPDNPDPDNPDTPKNKYSITGKAWLDKNKDGEMNGEDNILEGIKVKLLDTQTNQFVKDAETNKEIEIATDSKGYYIFSNIEEGKYIVVFDYDNTLYKPTTYQKLDVEDSKNSDAVSKELIVNGYKKEYAVTNEIDLTDNVSNLNLGLVYVKRFEVKVDKYISKVIVQTSRGTTSYDYQFKNFIKVEIPAKQMLGSTILVQYTIRVTNNGDVDAYVNELVDYAPTGLKFNSELNTDWYESDEKLITNKLSKDSIKPGESRAINLTLIKNKTEASAELINNMAEIQEAYNIYGIEDINSTYGNKNKDEGDLGSADLLIGVQTGKAASYILLIISMIGFIGVGALLINKKVIKKEF